MLTDILNPDRIQNQINDLENLLFIILTHRLADRNRILPCLFLICRQQETAHNGEVVAVLVGDSATIKRFYKESGHFRLQPENDHMDPIIVDDCRILGKVVSLVRMKIH